MFGAYKRVLVAQALTPMRIEREVSLGHHRSTAHLPYDDLGYFLRNSSLATVTWESQPGLAAL